MTHSEDDNHESVVFNQVENPVVTHSNPPFVSVGEMLRSVGSRLMCQRVNDVPNRLGFSFREFASSFSTLRRISIL